ncbi:MAG: hypothetical protein A2902_04805 [Elusimicrobia bacterium RIFCSPLOWO2_01_FULL_64_13]|nr:MAG: hypothetical protein A2636_06585 [Elusimicrobia bacterium RIFCSPHIGHO2_01_FULL_64_10]OGR95257.1 MAG: hypothetical protein A2902_04805 [Elusimicrobia bacterium RIFCSPLOWO2_01_FULL_64_13]
MRSSNPALNSKTFAGFDRSVPGGEVMTLEGTVNKTGILLLLALVSASWTWGLFFTQRNPAAVAPWMVLGAIGGFVVAMVTVFKKEWSGITAPAYALLEGLLLGGLSSLFEARYPGIVIQAVGLTFGTLFALLVAYKSRLIRVTQNFRLGVAAATGGIALFYLASMVMGFFGWRMPFIHETGILGIGFSLFVVGIAALNLVMDFDFIENGAAAGAPKFMEWYGAFGLIVTLVWLYLEILRLLAKLRDRK